MRTDKMDVFIVAVLGPILVFLVPSSTTRRNSSDGFKLVTTK